MIPLFTQVMHHLVDILVGELALSREHQVHDKLRFTKDTLQFYRQVIEIIAFKQINVGKAFPDRHLVRFRRIKAPTKGELIKLTHKIASRVSGYLERQGMLERDTGNIFLTPEAMDAADEDPSNQLLGSSITYRIAVGPQQGRKVLTLQTLPDCESDNPFSSSVGEVAGFSLHAGVATNANEREKLERLCRYITRPAVSTKRMSMTRNGRVRYELKTPWRNGTTHVVFEPTNFMYRTYGMPRAQEAQEWPFPGWSPWFPNPELTSRDFMVCSRPIASIDQR